MTLQTIKSELAELKSLLSGLLNGKATSDQVAGFSTRLTSLEGSITTELSGHLKTIEARDATILELTGKITAKDGEISTLKTNLEAAGKKANEVLAKQGLDPALVPSAEAKAGDVETAWSKYQRLSASNPREAGAFWASDADKILASRPK